MRPTFFAVSPQGQRFLRAQRGAWSQRLARATYTQKWPILGSVIGVIAGFGAVVFCELLRLSTFVVLQVLAGHRVRPANQ